MSEQTTRENDEVTAEEESVERHEANRVTPELDDEVKPERFRQDTRPVDGEGAIHPPAELELDQKSHIQG